MEPYDDLLVLAAANLVNNLRMILSFLDAMDPPPWRQPRVGQNLPEILRMALEEVARERGGIERLVEHRPGSWEADLVRRLAAGADY